MAGLALTITAALVAAAAPPALAGGGAVRTLTVDSGADNDRPGTLRSAIETSNARPGSYRIVVKPSAGVIKLNSLLPPLVGPVRLAGPPTGSGRPRVGIDGANVVDVNRPVLNNNTPNDCPSTVPNSQGAFTYGPNVRSTANPGLAVKDSGRVEISNLLIRNPPPGPAGRAAG